MPVSNKFKTDVKKFEVYPEGIYEAVLEDITEKGEVETQWGLKQQLEFRFNLTKLNKPITQTVANTWSPPGKYQQSKYYQIATTLGATKKPEPPTPDELNALIGQPVTLSIKVMPRKDGNGDRNQITDFISARNEA